MFPFRRRLCALKYDQLADARLLGAQHGLFRPLQFDPRFALENRPVQRKVLPTSSLCNPNFWHLAVLSLVLWAAGIIATRYFLAAWIPPSLANPSSKPTSGHKRPPGSGAATNKGAQNTPMCVSECCGRAREARAQRSCRTKTLNRHL